MGFVLCFWWHVHEKGPCTGTDCSQSSSNIPRYVTEGGDDFLLSFYFCHFRFTMFEVFLYEDFNPVWLT